MILLHRSEPQRIATVGDASVMVRQARPDDVLLLADLIYHLSARTRYLRFMRPLPLSLERAWAEARRMARQSPERHLTLVATVGAGMGEQAVAAAELAREPGQPQRAEFALLVRDDYQALGIGSALGRQLVARARAMGISQLHGDMLAENRAMRRLLRRLGEAETTTSDGFTHAVLKL